MKVLVSEETFPSKKPCTMSVFDLWMKPFQNCIIARVQGTNTMVFVLQPPPLLRLNRWIYLFNILLREKLFVLWQDIRCSWVPNIVSGVRVPQSVVFCVVLCRLVNRRTANTMANEGQTIFYKILHLKQRIVWRYQRGIQKQQIEGQTMQ
jgi:hypothetical protein